MLPEVVAAERQIWDSLEKLTLIDKRLLELHFGEVRIRRKSVSQRLAGDDWTRQGVAVEERRFN